MSWLLARHYAVLSPTTGAHTVFTMYLATTVAGFGMVKEPRDALPFETECEALHYRAALIRINVAKRDEIEPLEAIEYDEDEHEQGGGLWDAVKDFFTRGCSSFAQPATAMRLKRLPTFSPARPFARPTSCLSAQRL